MSLLSELFDKIKSMSAAEKRHFKLHAHSTSKDKLPIYVQLFNKLNKQFELDESAIEKRGFKPTDKKLLQKKIEESLHVQYLGRSVDSKLKWWLESMPRLYERGHWSELRKCIKKTRQLAEYEERFMDALQTIRWKKKLLEKEKNNQSKNFYERCEELIKEEIQLRRKLNEEIDCHNLRMQIDALRLKDINLEDPIIRQKFKKIIDIPIVNNNTIPSSLKAQINYFHSKCIIALLYTKQPTQAYQYAQQPIDVFENNESFKNAHLLNYIKSLCLLCQVCYRSGKSELIPAIIEKIEYTEKNDKYGFKAVCLYGILYAITNLDKEKGEQYIRKIEHLVGSNKYNIRDGRKLTLYYNIMVFYSLFDNWQESEKWLKKIIEYKQRTDDRRDLQHASRIWKLVVHYELFLDLDSCIKSVIKFIRAYDQDTETNQYIIQTFRNLDKAINYEEQQSIWQALQEFLIKKITKQSPPTRQLILHELQLWCQAKLQRTTMAETVRKG